MYFLDGQNNIRLPYSEVIKITFSEHEGVSCADCDHNPQGSQADTKEHYKMWIDGLKVGSEIVVEQPYTIMPLYLSTVVKITHGGGTIVKGFSTLLFKDGEASSGGKYLYTLLEPTDYILDKINLANIRRQLRSINWDTADEDVVRDVWDLTFM